MSWGLVIAGTLTGGAQLWSSYQQSQAAQNAANTQAGAAQAGIDENKRQFDAFTKLLSPFVQAGNQGLTGQQDLLGLNGAQAQGSALDAIQRGPEYQRTLQAGQNAILQNASATGGLRGGNIQGGLANFGADALNAAINNQYNRLGQMTTLGQNSAAGVGAAGLQNAQQLAGLYGQQGAAQAGGQLAQGQAGQGVLNSILAGLGTYTGLGGGFGGQQPGGASLIPQNNQLLNVPFTQGGFKL